MWTRSEAVPLRKGKKSDEGKVRRRGEDGHQPEKEFEPSNAL